MKQNANLRDSNAVITFQIYPLQQNFNADTVSVFHVGHKRHLLCMVENKEVQRGCSIILLLRKWHCDKTIISTYTVCHICIDCVSLDFI